MTALRLARCALLPRPAAPDCACGACAGGRVRGALPVPRRARNVPRVERARQLRPRRRLRRQPAHVSTTAPAPRLFVARPSCCVPVPIVPRCLCCRLLALRLAPLSLALLLRGGAAGCGTCRWRRTRRRRRTGPQRSRSRRRRRRPTCPRSCSSCTRYGTRAALHLLASRVRHRIVLRIDLV